MKKLIIMSLAFIGLAIGSVNAQDCCTTQDCKPSVCCPEEVSCCDESQSKFKSTPNSKEEPKDLVTEQIKAIIKKSIKDEK